MKNSTTNPQRVVPFTSAVDVLEQLDAHNLLKTKPLVNGQWLASDVDFEVVDPATQSILAMVDDTSPTTAEQAITAAQQAFTLWKKTSGFERSERLMAWHDQVISHIDLLSGLICIENGKPYAEARSEVYFTANFIRWFAEEAKRISGEIITNPSPTIKGMILQQPIGVCVGITPWNFPLSMIARKVAPALAAGCTVVLKPAHQTPLSALALAELAMRAHIPSGVFNVLPTSANMTQEIGQLLCTHETVKHVSYTGSTPIGTYIMALASQSAKKVSLELGGHAPCIVFDDANIEIATQLILQSKFRNTGQTCISCNRVYVHESLAMDLTNRLKTAMATLSVGHGLEPTIQIGPLINAKARQKMQDHVNDALNNGAKILFGGQAIDHPLYDGFFFEPTLLHHVQDDMRVMREETFGPILPIATFSDDDEVIARANQTPFGLAAYCCTNSLARYWKAIESLEFGMIGMNTANITHEGMPFGGMKESGIGREGGSRGIEEYLECKFVATLAP